MCELGWWSQWWSSLRVVFLFWRSKQERLAILLCFSNILSLFHYPYRWVSNDWWILSDFRCWEDGDLHLRLLANGAHLAVMDAVLTTSIRHRRDASSNHLYCHRCRIALLKSYVDQQLPIEPPVMANELIATGSMLLCERCFGEALTAYQLAHRVHPMRPQSNQKFVRWLMALMPPLRALFMQQWLRQTLGQYLRPWKWFHACATVCMLFAGQLMHGFYNCVFPRFSLDLILE